MWWNLGSIVLGLCAWALPLWYLSRRTKGGCHRAWPQLLSLSCCAISMWFQILEGCRRVVLRDWSFFLDTAAAEVWVSGFLLVTVLLLNGGVAWLDRSLVREKEQEQSDGQ